MLNLVFLFKFFVLIMLRNIFRHFFAFICHLVVCCIKFFVHILQSRPGHLEKRNGHLVETARTWLLHMQVPFCFWSNAIPIACYLINRMPSIVLMISHFLFYFHEMLFTLYLYKSLGLFTLFISFLSKLPNCLLIP